MTARHAALLLCLVLATSPAAARTASSAHAAAARAGHAVVLVKYVLAREGHGFSATGQRIDVACVGTIVSADGLVAVPGAIFPDDPEEQREAATPRDFVVRLSDGRSVEARLLGRDRQAGLAFLQLAGAAGETFPFVRFQDAALAPGDELLLLELLPQRYGFAPTMRPARVAAFVTEPRDLVDVDARLDESAIGAPALDSRGRAVGLMIVDPLGDSPGPLVAAQRVIGIFSRQKETGMPMLLPAKSLTPLIASPPREAAEPGERAWLGVTLQPVPRALAEALRLPGPGGVMVTSVWPGSPAEAAGLAVEDVITRFDGKPVTVETEEAIAGFIEIVQRTGARKTVQIETVRAGVTRTVDLTLGVAPPTAVRVEEYRNKSFGLAAQDLTLDIRLARAWPESLAGAIVTEVETAGWAQVGGLQRGDVVQAVDGQPVANVKELESRLAAAEAAKAKEVVFFVLRDPDTLFVRVETSW